MSEREIFSRFCDWNGLLGWGPRILNVYKILSTSLEGETLDLDHVSAHDNDDVVETLRKRGEFPDFSVDNFPDQEFAEYISKLTLENAFSSYLTWHGIIGYEQMILSAISTIKNAKD